MVFPGNTAPKPKSHSPFAYAMRAAVRFPLQIPVTLNMNGTKIAADTVDVSSTGVLFTLETLVAVGTELTWELCLPAEAMGSASDISIDCRGRVVWVHDMKPLRMAVMIDQYQMKESVR